MKIRHRTRPIAAIRAQTVRQSLHSGQVRAHTRTTRMELLVHVLRLLVVLLVPRLLLMVLLLLVVPRVSLAVLVLLHLLLLMGVVVVVVPRMAAA